ncbi:tryptophanyl-tRNA synthetase [Halolamina pelagica]|uniref:Tryptophanyl-tRNA synthetase n=1 Tax=Halolamina pelagica TaxID=699431 RepID=A0A0P7H0C5_9EURY|nr:tryptophanyl-tRNA synthetase [Halolamina pelagica]
MASHKSDESTFQSLYRTHVGDPETDDEVRGYWLFVVGVVLAVAGVLLFLASEPQGGVRQLSIVMVGGSMLLLLVGPVLRLPLKPRATTLVYVGATIATIGIVYFVAVFPGGWSLRNGNTAVIGIYGLGLLVAGAGGVLVPLLAEPESATPESATDPGELRRELAALDDVLEDTAADEADLAAEIADLRRAVGASDDAVATLSHAVTALSQDLADAETDRDELAEQLWGHRTSQARFELYEDRGGEFRWRLRHRNGQIVATSGEGYTQRHNAQNGIESVRDNALGAMVLRIESEAELADAGERFEPVEETESQTAFELYEDRGGEFRWRLRHDNGNVVADAGEGYSRRRDARAALERVQTLAGPAEYLRIDPTGFEIYRDAAEEWRWRLVHRNGNVLADGGEGYSSRRGARRAVDRIREGIDDLTFETYEDAADEHRWRLRASNGQLVADSGEGYSRKSGVDDAVERVRAYAPEADVLNVGFAAFEVYEDNAGEFRWRLRHRNGQIVATGSEGYTERSKAENAVDRFKLNAPGSAIEDLDEASETA